MVSLIKNQILKHLSIYAKNLSSDKINLSTFRGEGELSNFELDEVVLTELLELPTWLRITSAWCNHVSFRISWTKLKSVPIVLTLDEVKIVVETCDSQSRQQCDRTCHSNGGGGGGGVGCSTANNNGVSVTSLSRIPPSKYSFIHKVVDGITIIVNTVNVKFMSAAFTASVQMSRIRVESKTPKWINADLRFTRLKDVQRGIILIFKELSWQTVRIEASSTQDKSLTPLRLLTNQAKCRITIRKRLTDCYILASRLVLILDDLLWVLTDSQLKAALHFVDSLLGLVKAATDATQKTKAARKLATLPEYQAQLAQQQQTRAVDSASTGSSMQRMFNAFDVRETSYHFFSQRIDLHLCDDEGDGRSSYPELNKGGALQISVQAFQVDYYPYHLAKSDRSHWAKYREASVAPALWLKESLNSFREAVLNFTQPNRPPSHAPLERSTPNSPITLNPTLLASQYTNNVNNSSKASHSSGSSTPSQGNVGSISSLHSFTNGYTTQSVHQKQVLDNLNKLMSSCFILRIEDFQFYRVTTAGKKQMPKEFISGDKERYSFPSEIPILHAEFTYFYYPGDFEFPLPSSKIFVHIDPLQMNFDLSSILWLNSFALNLHESLLHTSVGSSSSSSLTTSHSATETWKSQSSTLRGSEKVPLYQENAINESRPIYMDVKVEAIMPRLRIESLSEATQQKDRPKMMEIQVSRFVLSNIREMGSSRADLAQALQSLQDGSLVFGNGFPSAKGDMSLVTDRIMSHMSADVTATAAATGLSGCFGQGDTQYLTRYALWSEPRDIWCIKFDPLWIDFIGARSLGTNKPIPFIDAVPITLWMHSGNQSTTSPEALHANGDSIAKDSPTDMMNHRPNTVKLPRNPFLDSEEDLQFEGKSPESSSQDQNSVAADFHIIAHIANLVSLQIDHYQYLFLLRLAEEMTEMTTFLSLDADRIMLKQKTNKSIILGCVIPQMEITFVMPSPTPGKESSGGDAESVLPDSASLAEDLHLNNSNLLWTKPSSFDKMKNHTIGGGSVETPSSINEAPYDSGIHLSNISNLGPVALKPLDAGGKVQQLPSPQSRTNHSTRNSSSSDATSITKEINTSLMSMKKGFTSLMTSIDSAITLRSANDDVSDTYSIQSDVSSDSENFSIVLGDDKTTDCIDIMFRLNPFNSDVNFKASPIEVASEVYEETCCYKTNLSSPSEPSECSTWRRRDLVSMATFRLTTVEIIHQGEGNNSILRLQVAALSCDECAAIPWDELQHARQKDKNKFGARCKAWNLAAYNQEQPPCVRMRLEQTLQPPNDLNQIGDKSNIKSWFTSNAMIRVSDISLDVNMSTIVGLADLVEDEILDSQPIPLNIMLENIRLNLLEDRPPVNITSPGSVPINLTIGNMRMERDKRGVIHIQPLETKLKDLTDSTASVYQQSNPVLTKLSHVASQRTVDAAISDPVSEAIRVRERERERDTELVTLQVKLQQIKYDNENLRKQLQNAKDNTETYRKKTKQENEALRSYLKAAQDDVSALLEEKRALLDTIRSLQHQMSLQNMNPNSNPNLHPNPNPNPKTENTNR